MVDQINQLPTVEPNYNDFVMFGQRPNPEGIIQRDGWQMNVRTNQIRINHDITREQFNRSHLRFFIPSLGNEGRSPERRAADAAWRAEPDSETELPITPERIRPFIAMANDPFDFDESKHQNRMLENALTPGYVFTDTDLHDIKYIHEENDLWLDTHPGNRGSSRECAFIGNAFLARYPNRSVRNEIYLLAANQINLQESDNEFESDSENEEEDNIPAVDEYLSNMLATMDTKKEDPVISDEQYERLVANNLNSLAQLELNAENANWA
jgi:hypothetical protein